MPVEINSRLGDEPVGIEPVESNKAHLEGQGAKIVVPGYTVLSSHPASSETHQVFVRLAWRHLSPRGQIFQGKRCGRIRQYLKEVGSHLDRLNSLLG